MWVMWRWIRTQRRPARIGWHAAALACAISAGCGGGASSPTGPTTTTPAEVFAVNAFVYYDENSNNTLDPGEDLRFGDVDIEIAGRSGHSEAGTGRVVVQGVPRGTQTVAVHADSLPPFFVAAGVTADVPPASEVAIPVVLPIGQNMPFSYLASGDSISQGTGSRDGNGYRIILQARLGDYYQRRIVTYYRGGGGGSSADGAFRIARDLQLLDPAYTLIAWGTNDWISCDEPPSCPTIPNLRSMVRDVKAAHGLPCIATIIPTNVGFDERAPASRNTWVAEMNDLIRAMAREEGALVVDLYAAFMAAPRLSDLFVDHVHPNPEGHELIAGTWFNFLTRPRRATGSASASDGLPQPGYAATLAQPVKARASKLPKQ